MDELLITDEDTESEHSYEKTNWAREIPENQKKEDVQFEWMNKRTDKRRE